MAKRRRGEGAEGRSGVAVWRRRGLTPFRLFASPLLLLAACRGDPPASLGAQQVSQLVDSLRPSVEKAVGLPFKSPPRSAMVTKEQVRAYLAAKVQKEFPAARVEGVQAAYRLLGLLPDSLDLKRLLLDLYAEQVAGYYDPETGVLYGVQGGDRAQLRLVMAHEMVHALQHQYLPLDSLMLQQGDGDRLAASQAVLEGHATIASIRILAPQADVVNSADFWESYREQVRNQQRLMPVFAKAPLILREGLVFPYLGGAEFMRWWAANRKEALPTGALLPVSTEQVLHPDRYASQDRPVRVAFPDSGANVMFEDTLGELETQILIAVLRGAPSASLDVPLGWGGDRYRVYRTPDGPALVWLTAWDGQPQADRFRDRMAADFVPRAKAGYRVTVTPEVIAGKPGVRITNAPLSFPGK